MEYKKIENNETPEVCSKCKGYCCKAYSGIYHPNDFEDIEKELIKLKEENLISIDQWDGPLMINDDEDNDYYDIKFVRPRHTNAKSFVDLSYGGVCIHLTDHGCKLSFEKRPYQCKMLTPINGQFAYGCSSPYNKREAAIAWIPYQHIIQKLINN